ncbi:hypothetical protein [Treponema primitia]|nr:hypothetical protein [Treponema primitia]
MDYIFANRRYFTLQLEDISIDSFLEHTSGGYITLDFNQSTSPWPALFMGDTRSNSSLTPHPLYRHSDADSRPSNPNNRYLTNNSDLNNSDNIKEDASRQNWDVARNTQQIPGEAYTYVSMYIMSYGIEDNFSSIFSIPTFIGIFRLPNEM